MCVSLPGAAEGAENHAEVVMGVAVVWPEAQGRLEVGHGFLQPVDLGQRDPEVVFGVGVIGLQPQRRLIVRDCLSGAIELTERDLPRAAVTEKCPAAAEGPVRFGTAVSTLLASGSVIAMMFCFLLQNAVSWVVIGWMPTYLHERFSLAQGAAGLSATAYLYAAQIIGLLVSGAWSDRWSRTNPRARIYVPVIGLCLSTPGFFIAAHSPTLGLTILCLALWGLATGFMGSNVMPILCLITDRRYRATAYGLANGVGAVAGGLSILGAGAMRDLHFDLSRGLVFAGLAAAICAVLFLVIRLKGSEAA